MAPLFGEFDPSKADQAVLSLFSSSDGPVTKPSRSKRVKLAAEAKAASANDEEQFSDLEGILNDPDSDAKPAPKERQNKEKSSKKRKKPHVAAADNGDDEAIAEIEDKYLQKLLDQEDAAPKNSTRSKEQKTKQVDASNADEATMGGLTDSEGSGDEEADTNDGADEKDKTKLVHDTLLHDDEEVLKARGTVFVGNLPSDAISSRTDYATLKKHFAQYGKIKSIRFRSIAFSEMLPRKVAFIKQKLHDKRHTVNAYIVYDSEDSARKSLQSNGVVLQGHHIRVDSVAHPAKQDSKRSVFIGNLDFDAEEESLWEHFGKVGAIEYVRIIRDSKTNVGKGFAYVQFKDSMYVAKALLLNDKKMGNRMLRVTRARSMRAPKERVKQPVLKSGLPKLDPDMKAQLGRAKKIVGKAERAQLSSVIEGERASQAAGTSLKAGGGGKKKGKPRIRARSTAFKRNKKQGGDKKKADA
ncbi:hypothetical protein POJ06DRAFT_140555 [Lipomyces tetrasporus]|uniref:Nucleolar protein 12 n=1 Tax=Lipomyces tetrasporus TaxID=54092 RepID=A0AAD7QP07_9ASCO|nr:uncharacterized protein POJ06DRAFT_140555 [Lipomyces tetrasporus]KAJ8098716.1 hypothetical protein POJ06DRAFT_140555 [Lipomyces tetrasporus]